MNSEKDVKNAVKKILKSQGWFYWMPGANGFGRVGISDFCCLKRGVFVAIETKFGRNKPTGLQQDFLNKIDENDGFSFVVDETTVGDLPQWLDALAYRFE